MATNITKNRLQEFITALTEKGGVAGNVTLRARLGWDEEFYWKVQGHLIEKGEVLPGRGKGGSVRLPQPQAHKTVVIAQTFPLSGQERALYSPLRASIHTKWINRFGFDEFRVEETHSQGSKNTGGTFTRPDITAAGIRRYVYLPKRLEIVTFEVKSNDAITIAAVLEAIAHREAAHRSYVIYAASRSTFDDAAESDRILELSQKYGIGIVFAERPQEVESWEIVIDAIRHEPDPARLDRFLGDLPNEAMKRQLSKWKE